MGDEVIYFTTPKEESRPFFKVIYEDVNALIVDKYASVNTEGLAVHLKERCGARPVHRLDRNTAGVIAFAKNEIAEKALIDAFRSRRVQKIYETICFYPFTLPHELLTAYLKKDAGAARVSVYGSPRAGAEAIQTEYIVLAEYGEYSLVKIILHSGKTHQIRAHMAFAGHPVAGDDKYGDETLNKKYHLHRQILVAKSLMFDFSSSVLGDLCGKTFVSSFSAQLPQ